MLVGPVSIRGLRECAALAGELQGVRPVAVMDREADVYAVFAEQRRLGSVDLLVRAQHNRALGKGAPKLFEAVRGGGCAGSLGDPRGAPVGTAGEPRAEGAGGPARSGWRKSNCAGRRWSCRTRTDGGKRYG